MASRPRYKHMPPPDIDLKTDIDMFKLLQIKAILSVGMAT